MKAELSKGEVVYVTTENGKVYKLGNLLEHRKRLLRIDEIRQDQTLRRSWYRSHVQSRDVPNSKAERADYGDGGNWERKLVKWLDAEFSRLGDAGIPLPCSWAVQFGERWYFRCVIAKRNAAKIADELMLLHWHRVGRFVAAVWQNGSEDREKTIQDFGISQATYYRRLEKYAEILHFSKRC